MDENTIFAQKYYGNAENECIHDQLLQFSDADEAKTIRIFRDKKGDGKNIDLTRFRGGPYILFALRFSMEKFDLLCAETVRRNEQLR